MGSAWVGRTIVRTVFDASGEPSTRVCGRVVGWLPADRSDFTDAAGRPASLWRVVYDGGGTLDGDEEDLEEFELEESVLPSTATSASRLALRGGCDITSPAWLDSALGGDAAGRGWRTITVWRVQRSGLTAAKRDTYFVTPGATHTFRSKREVGAERPVM